MHYVEAPKVLQDSKNTHSIFLAGGITGCSDWQSVIVNKLVESDFILVNPRRKDFPIYDSSAAEAQIKWEFDHLRKADIILFWFPKETLCPIVLFELGAWLMTHKTIYIGVDPLYARKQDVEIQTKLVRPDIEIVYSLEDLATQISNFPLTTCQHTNTHMYRLFEESNNSWWFKICSDCGHLLNDKKENCTESDIEDMLRYDSEITSEQKHKIIDAFKQL